MHNCFPWSAGAPLVMGVLIGAVGTGVLQKRAAAQNSAPVAPEKKPVASAVINPTDLTSKNSGVGTHRDLFDGPSRTLLNLEGRIS